MRKVIKSNILGFILGGLIFGSIGIYAANLYNANDISYTTNDGTKTNVNDALNELYNEGSDTGKAILLGTARTYDLSSYPGYQNFTANNFICVVDGFETRVGNSDFSGNIGANTWYYAPTKSYNASTGVLTIGEGTTFMQLHVGGIRQLTQNKTLTVRTYLIPGGIS